MTVKSVRDQARERLLQRADRQAQIEERAEQVADYVLRTELVRAPDVKVHAVFNAKARGLDTFYVHIAVDMATLDKMSLGPVMIHTEHPYQVNHAAGQGLEQVSIVRESDPYDALSAQVWQTQGGSSEFDDIIDAILDATGWTLEDLS